MTILLRTMTRKSTFSGGQYNGVTVQSVINLGITGKEYVIYSYFQMSMISFADDILLELGITEEFKINKPGKDITAKWKYKDATYTEQDRLENWKWKNKHNCDTAKHNKRRDSVMFNKKNLMANNHNNFNK